MSRVLAKRALFCHPAEDCAVLRGMGAKLALQDDTSLTLEYVVVGDIGRLRIPAAAPPLRTDGLWQTTCFELFVTDAEGYREFNFSPSGQWAAYRFTGYREGMTPLDMPAPVIAPEQSEEQLTLTVKLDPAVLPPMPWKMGLSAVIEEEDGTKSYWALAHPAGKPDFHHPACFAQELPAPKAS